MINKNNITLKNKMAHSTQWLSYWLQNKELGLTRGSKPVRSGWGDFSCTLMIIWITLILKVLPEGIPPLAI